MFNGFDIFQKSRVKTDHKRLQQIVLNLLSNAVKFTNEEGLIEIIIEKIDECKL